MKKRFEKTLQELTRVARGVSFSGHEDNERDQSLGSEIERAPDVSSTSSFPPTRAARVSRSRGTFLVERGKAEPKKNRSAKASLAAFTLAVGGILLTLFASSPFIVSGVALARNPGPAIVAEFDSTTVVLPGFTAEVDEYFNILINPED